MIRYDDTMKHRKRFHMSRFLLPSRMLLRLREMHGVGSRCTRLHLPTHVLIECTKGGFSPQTLLISRPSFEDEATGGLVGADTFVHGGDETGGDGKGEGGLQGARVWWVTG